MCTCVCVNLPDAILRQIQNDQRCRLSKCNLTGSHKTSGSFAKDALKPYLFKVQ